MILLVLRDGWELLDLRKIFVRNLQFSSHPDVTSVGCLLKSRTRLLVFLFGKRRVRQKKIRFTELRISLASWLDRDRHRRCLQMGPCRHCSLSRKLAKDGGGARAVRSVSEREPEYSGGEPCPRTRIGTICLLRVKKTAVTLYAKDSSR